MADTVRVMTERDWGAVAEIYQQGIDTGNATFQSSPPASWQAWCKGRIGSCSLVAERDGEVRGWACLSPVSDRCVYAGVAEVSVYVAARAQSQGVGDALMRALIDASERSNIWTLQAGIFPENRSSIRLHEKYGFRSVGTREKLGKMTFGIHAGKWRDVLLFERRSRVAGSD
jgi:L-amino acid N-acyltransferase YncA